MRPSAGCGIDPSTGVTTLSEYGTANMKLALRSLESKTTDTYVAGWANRVTRRVGHLPITMIAKLTAPTSGFLVELPGIELAALPGDMPFELPVRSVSVRFSPARYLRFRSRS